MKKVIINKEQPKKSLTSKKEEVVKLSHREHILKIPDTYIGSTESCTEDFWYFDEESNSMIKKELTIIPGFYKLFDEIIVNSLDQYVRQFEKVIPTDVKNLHLVKNIKINIDKETGIISVSNDGEGIKTHIHEKEKKYIPELIFGHLLTSTNYDENEIKHVGGKNGYGAKLVNIFSTKFSIETIDHNNGKKYIQHFYDNMTRNDKPKITSNKGKPYTKITYLPDYKRFNLENITDDMYKVMEKRAYDMAAFTKNFVNIYFNDKKIDCRTFDKYVDLYLGDKKEFPRVYEKINNRWEIAIALNPKLTFEQISFVNGIYTSKGGKHVDSVVSDICKKLSEFILKKKKLNVKANYIKENIIIFINCTIDNPSFSSQTKESLTTAKAKFGSKCEISNKFIEKVSKCGIMEKALELANAKDNKAAEKNNGKKQTRLKGVPKLEDANWAGTKKSNECTIIFTEGDSAKATALAGLAIVGRDKYGVFPLKGKVLNVRDIKNIKKIIENEEIKNLIKIMGLEINKTYTSIDSLRYGKLWLFTDQDEDGSHIKGLLFNLFNTLWPSLFTFPNFLNSMITPVVKVKKNKKVLEFFSVKDYDKWKSENDTKGWTSKYYKGLGTSTPQEAREYFKKLNVVNYTSTSDNDKKSIDLAFSKVEGSSDLRKQWLGNYDENDTLDYNEKTVSITDFVNKDLKHFSNSDNCRSIPNMVDGLKTSQRKVLFTALKRNLVKEIRVAQFAGSVSEMSAYHHGEMSLNSTITNMAQDFVGSNNINLLDPIGQFGSRLSGGKDSAQPRYIHTKLMDITKKIFNQNDFKLLDYKDDDGLLVEPIYYMPIIPMILVNGSTGIGTGWSTEIPCFNPKDIIANILNIINGKEYIELIPYYRNFMGTIEKIDSNTFKSTGIYHFKKDDILVIEELPIGVWTDKYKEYLESITIDSKNDSKKQFIRYYNSYCSDKKVHFEIYLSKDKKMDKFIYNKEKLEKLFKLSSSINTGNMVTHTRDCKLNKYNNVEEILKEFIDIRLEYYQKRKDFMLGELEKEINLLEVKIRFIMDFIEGRLLISNKSKNDILEQLEKLKYPKLEESYDYLLNMKIYNLTKDKIDEFNKSLKDRKEEYNLLKIKTPKSLWTSDLKELISFMKKNKYIKE